MILQRIIMALCLAMTVSIWTQAEDRPNIVLIVSDDHGTDALGFLGNKVIKTPALDMLAADGTYFTRAFATTSSCSPSRSVILTGLQNHANGMYGLQHKQHHFQSFDNIRSLPVILAQEGGYRTARIGKYHLAPVKVYDFGEVLSEGAANDMASLARSPVEMAQKVRDFVTRNDKPFFLYFATDDPHRAFPFNTSPAPNSFGNRKEGYPGVKEVTYRPDQVIVPPFLPDSMAARKELAQYYQSVSRLDQGVGALLRLLKDTGKYENTLVIYLSDNGIAFPGAKTTLYDPGIHLPLIIRSPGQEYRGGHNNDLVSWVDITPTILDYAGIQIGDRTFHGLSLKHAVDRQEELARSAIYASHSFHEIQMYYPMRMIRTGKFKLIHNFAASMPYPVARDLYESLIWQDFMASGEDVYGQRPVRQFTNRPTYELYDLENDPAEVVNLAGDAQYKMIFHDLKKNLREFQKTSDDPWYLSWKTE